MKHFGRFTASSSEIEDFIFATVHGKKQTSDRLSNNRLRNAKARLNITLKMWEEDMSSGLLSVDELLNDKYLDFPYIQKIISKIKLYKNEIHNRSILKNNMYKLMIKPKLLCL